MERQAEKWDVHWSRDALPPWDTGTVSSHLIEILSDSAVAQSLRRFCAPQAIDVGCGSGLNALALARSHAFERVVGVDVAEAALARARTLDTDGLVEWSERSIFTMLDGTNTQAFALVFDRQVFHDLRFVDEVSMMDVLIGLLAPGGTLVLILGATDDAATVATLPGTPRATAPPKIGPPKVDRTEIDEIVARFHARAEHALRGAVTATVSLSTFDRTPQCDPAAPRAACWVVRLALPF